MVNGSLGYGQVKVTRTDFGRMEMVLNVGNKSRVKVGMLGGLWWAGFLGDEAFLRIFNGWFLGNGPPNLDLDAFLTCGG